MSVEFEPVKLGRRQRRLDPVAIGAVAVAFALAIAVLKPWQGIPTIDAPAKAPPVQIGTAGSASPIGPASPPDALASVGIPAIGSFRATSSPTWAAVEPVIRQHDEWGIRTIVVALLSDTPTGTNRRLVERWFPLPGGEEARALRVDSNDRSIVALGITFPPAETPLDTRIWRIGADGLEWIDAAPLDPVPSGGAFLYVQPGNSGGPLRTWSAGRYRIDVLVQGSIRQLRINIPDRFSNIPEPTARPALREAGPLPDPAGTALPDLPIGLFAAVDGFAVPLPGEEGESLEEAAAWLDLDAGTGREPRSSVATAYLPRATGLGVMLPPGSVVQSAAMTRLAPEAFTAVPTRVEAAGREPAPTDHVLFRAPDAGAWTPGVYRIAVVWADTDGLHDRSWHAEMRPGPVRETPRMLAAARGWARYAGATGVILGTTEPPESGPRPSRIQNLALEPESDSGYPAATGVGCGGTVIGGSPGILGFAYPGDRYASTASARILRPFLRRADVVLMTAAFGTRGLILAAPARNPTLAAGTYEFTIGDGHNGHNGQTYALCLGMALFDD